MECYQKMKTYSKIKILLSAFLALSLLIGMLPTALADGDFKAVVTSKSMKVYSQNSPYKYLGSLSKGTTVTVKDYAKGVALISYNGKTGLAKISDMKKASSASVSSDSASSNTTTYDSKEVVALINTRVYSKPSTSSKYTSVKAGTSMTLLATNGNVAMVKRGSAVGYTVKSHLGDPDSFSTPVPENTEAPKEETVTSTPVITNCATRIYQKASTSSKSVSVGKGVSMNVVAVSGNIARVERNGVYGYIAKDHLSIKTADAPVQTTAPTPTPEPTATPAPTADTSKLESSISNSSTSSLFNSNYSNEEIVVRFLVKELGYSVAAACGVAGNIKYESGFKPTSSGDSGSSYGICQWHAARKTRLITWCGNNGYDYQTLEGQLFYLKYELTVKYPKVHKYLKACENSAQGAYDAGYYFCYHFEAPANRASKSVTRGNYAKNTVWARYV